MSAWIVSETHIEALLCGAIRRGICFDGVPVTSENATEVGKKLLEECIRSVQYRYPDYRPILPEDVIYDEDGDVVWEQFERSLPGPIPTPIVDEFVFRGEVDLSPTSLSKQIACYDYQSCETPDFHLTPSYRFCRDLEASLEAEFGEIHWASDEAERAPWGIDRDEGLYQRLKARGKHLVPK